MSNPMAILLTGVVMFVIIRFGISKLLGNTKYGKKHSDYVNILSIIISLIMISSLSFLRMTANMIPYLIIIFVSVLFAVLAFLGFGTDKSAVVKGLKVVFKNTYMWIIIILVIAWGVSTMSGQDLLEEQTPLTGLSVSEPKETSFDISLFFTKSVLSIAFVFIVLGLTFYTVNKNGS